MRNVPSPGKNDRRDSWLFTKCLKAARRGCRCRGHPSMHDNAGSAQTRRHYDHESNARDLPNPAGNATGVSYCYWIKPSLIARSRRKVPNRTGVHLFRVHSTRGERAQDLLSSMSRCICKAGAAQKTTQCAPRFKRIFNRDLSSCRRTM